MSGGDQRPKLPTPAWASDASFVELAVATRPGDLADRAAILERIHRYCWGYDERRLDQLLDCFTEDAVWEGSVMGETRVGPIEGRAAIGEWLSGFWPVQRDQRRHMILNAIVEEQSESSARVSTYLVLFGARHGQVSLETMGFYRYTAVREDDGAWRISGLFAGFDAPFWPGRLQDLSEKGRRRHGVFAELQS